MPNYWIESLKIWNQGKEVYCIPSKGSKEYEEIITIMNNLKSRNISQEIKQPIYFKQKDNIDNLFNEITTIIENIKNRRKTKQKNISIDLYKKYKNQNNKNIKYKSKSKKSKSKFINPEI